MTPVCKWYQKIEPLNVLTFLDIYKILVPYAELQNSLNNWALHLLLYSLLQTTIFH